MGDVLFEIFKLHLPPPILLRKITFQFFMSPHCATRFYLSVVIYELKYIMLHL